MKMKTLLLMVFSLSFVALSASAQEFEKNIMTGGVKGTYIQIGRDVASLGRNCGVTLNVQESAGSLQNLVAVKKRKNTQFGIVQSDVLEYVRTYSDVDPDLRRSLFGVRIMYPLYNEEIQILARRDINTLADLNGRKVAIGKADSGTFLTATLVLDIMKVKRAERIPLGASAALEKLQAGEIDAMFYVSGVPTKLFSNSQIDGSEFHLLEITDAPLLATYTPTEIPGGSYPFQPDTVSTIAVKAVLMTYDFKPGKNAYHKASCKATSDVASLILTNLDQLRKSGHPKWKDVDLTAIPPGWKVGACVKTGMAQSYELACEATSTNFSRTAEVDQEYLNLLKKRLKN